MGSESGRLSNRMDEIQRGCGQAALAAARRAYGGDPCVSCGGVQRDPAQLVPRESDHLQAVVASCLASGVIGRTPGPESLRTQTLAQKTVDAYTNQFGADSRFAHYRGPYIPPVCPPIPTEILNANVPKQSLRRCPLPNKGFNPVLPA
jgi:hypothetical protein